MRTHVIVMTAVVALTGLLQRPAAAQSSSDKATAEQLFAQGRKLMKDKKYEAACPKFEASLALDKALGTLLNLALCYEKLGKLASAWGNYKEAENLASRSGQVKREAYAREHAAAIEPRLPRLVIVLADAPAVDGLAITRDGKEVATATLDTPIYVDAGEHAVVARAPGYKEYATTVTATEGEEVTVEIPALERDPDWRTGTGEPTAEGRVTSRPGRSRRILGLSAGAVGVAALGLGLGFGLSARSAWNNAFDSGLCDRETDLCTPEGQAKTDAARSRANLSTALVSAGVVLAAAGVVLYLTAPGDEQRATVVPTAGAGELGFAVIRRF